ncbi:hemogen isoform X2 [Indicator indicator]|uniref:hemogen isoform X2 n=1 Tax=Indicator indicator TaxID=1002788 RepID=UPI0023DFC491|nr:hemogen isoform X2 [Indicator indicator]
MESLGKDHPYSDSSLQPPAARKEYAVPDVIITHRLRDRELLRKRKAEAQEKDSIQWDLREQEKNKRQRRGRGARRGRGRQLVVEPSLEPQLEPEPQPDPQKEDEAAPSQLAPPSEPAPPSQLAPPGPVPQGQLPMLTIHDLVTGMQPGVADEKLAVRSQDPVGELPDSCWPREEEVLKPAEAEIPEVLNTPLEYDHQDNEFHKHVLF